MEELLKEANDEIVRLKDKVREQEKIIKNSEQDKKDIVKYVLNYLHEELLEMTKDIKKIKATEFKFEDKIQWQIEDIALLMSSLVAAYGERNFHFSASRHN